MKIDIDTGVVITLITDILEGLYENEMILQDIFMLFSILSASLYSLCDPVQNKLHNPVSSYVRELKTVLGKIAAITKMPNNEKPC